jgi:hypothetical protein
VQLGDEGHNKPAVRGRQRVVLRAGLLHGRFAPEGAIAHQLQGRVQEPARHMDVGRHSVLLRHGGAEVMVQLL